MGNVYYESDFASPAWFSENGSESQPLSSGEINCTYQREIWRVYKDDIYAAINVIEGGLENTQELLLIHDTSLGRTTRKNKWVAERYEQDIEKMKKTLDNLRGYPHT